MEIPKIILRVPHHTTNEIAVLYGTSPDDDGVGLDVVLNGKRVFRGFNPSEITAWFEKSSFDNLMAWKRAYWKSGLKPTDFARPTPKVSNGESSAQRAARQRNNEERLRKVYPTLRPKMRAVIADMEALGWRPQIDVGVYRSPAEQAEKVRLGYSKVSYSYHCVTGPRGEPESLAADIVDTRYGWEPPTSYWLQLAACARAHDMETGIMWGLSAVKRAFIEKIVGNKDWGAKYAMGWDAAHVEAKGISLRQARAGVRPK